MITGSQDQDLNWTDLLLGQLTWHWENQLRPRLAGLTDAEYFWEPVPGWSVRPAGTSPAPMSVGTGDHRIDFAIPEPDPAPVTTIAWRIGHLLVGIFGDRNARHFGGTAVSYTTYDYPGSADDALRRLDDGYETWVRGVRGLTPQQLASPCGEPGFEADPMAALIVHIHREVIHHGAEIAVLRDLYAHGLNTDAADAVTPPAAP